MLVWNPDDDQLTTPALPHPSPVLAIEFAPDGKRLVTQSGVGPGAGPSGGEARVFGRDVVADGADILSKASGARSVRRISV